MFVLMDSRVDMIRELVCFILCLFLLGCKDEPSSVVSEITFDLFTAKQMNMTEFVDSITLIPLETNDSSLIKSVETLNVAGDTIFVEERGNMMAFDKKGDFLYSTIHLQGGGPKDYYSGLDFISLSDGGLEVFDAVRSRLIKYDKDLQYVFSHKLAKEILPVSWCVYLFDDYRLLILKDELKLYSLREDRIVSRIKVNGVPHFAFFNRNGLCMKNDEFFLSVYNQNFYYKLLLDNMDMKLEPVCKFDFGVESNFDVMDLPMGESERFYMDYMRDNPRKAYVREKFVDAGKRMCFFIYDNKSYFAYQDEEKGINQVYYNVPMTRKQFLPANLYKDNIFYYACEPQTLEYVVDESLMSSDDVEKMSFVREDDNPIIVCYKLK